MKKGQESQ